MGCCSSNSQTLGGSESVKQIRVLSGSMPSMPESPHTPSNPKRIDTSVCHLSVEQIFNHLICSVGEIIIAAGNTGTSHLLVKDLAVAQNMYENQLYDELLDHCYEFIPLLVDMIEGNYSVELKTHIIVLFIKLSSIVDIRSLLVDDPDVDFIATMIKFSEQPDVVGIFTLVRMLFENLEVESSILAQFEEQSRLRDTPDSFKASMVFFSDDSCFEDEEFVVADDIAQPSTFKS
ncbi:hypothetical protein PCE1_002618 [Barthelona sp. PCE]